MLLESENGLLVKFDQYMYQRKTKTYMYIVKQNKNFVTTTSLLKFRKEIHAALVL